MGVDYHYRFADYGHEQEGRNTESTGEEVGSVGDC